MLSLDSNTKHGERNVACGQGQLSVVTWRMLQEARALLGRLEYDRGNYEAALHVLEGIQGHNFGASLRIFIADPKLRQSKKGRQSKDGSSGKDGVLGTFLHGASLLLEALFLKAKCLQELDRHPGL